MLEMGKEFPSLGSWEKSTRLDFCSSSCTIARQHSEAHYTYASSYPKSRSGSQGHLPQLIQGPKQFPNRLALNCLQQITRPDREETKTERKAGGAE